MPEIEITPEQRDRLRSLQEEIARDVVGKYGHVRPKDAVEYLLDQYEHEDDEAASESVDSGEDTPADGVDAPDAENGAPTNPGSSDAGDGDATAETNGEAVARVVGDDGASETGDDGATNGDSASPDGATTETGAETETASESAAGGDSMLDQMLSLLDTHDDKWDESSAADERYAVELPDGGTEHVRTKDDVKALLFKHYR